MKSVPRSVLRHATKLLPDWRADPEFKKGVLHTLYDKNPASPSLSLYIYICIFCICMCTCIYIYNMVRICVYM